MPIFLIKLQGDQPPVEGAVPSKYYSDAISCWEVELDSLDDLLGLIKEVGCPVIISEHADGIHTRKDRQWELEIYDHWRE